MSVTENVKAGLLLSEAPGHRSRENVTIVSGQDLKYGDVVGKVTATGKYAIYANGAADGTEAAVGVLIGGDVDATSSDLPGAILVADAEVNVDLLGWGANDSTGITAGKAELVALGIKLRDGV